ncbi:family 2 glycosyl transferase [Stappia sp. 22II-S9-Z10]|nr:family 2 glycosyl transferase [Stappia sp. 22II-S9-Z10]
MELSARAPVRVALPLPPGCYRLTAAAPVAVRVAVVTAAGPIPLRLEAGEALFTSAEPVAGFDVWPTDRPAAAATLTVTRAAPWSTLAPDWPLGPLRQPPRAGAEGAWPRHRPSTPAGWMRGIRIAEAEGVRVTGDRFDVEETGLLRLAFDPPIGPGTVEMSGEFMDEAGKVAWVEPLVLADDAVSPRARLGTLRRVRGALYRARFSLASPTAALLLRPREFSGSVVIRRLDVVRLGPMRRAVRLADAVRARATWPAAVPRPPGRALAMGRPASAQAAPAAAGPSVTLITATRDAPGHLERFLETLAASRPGPKETILVDNGTTDARARALLEEAERAGHRVLSDARPFNFAALNNLAARTAQGDILVFANNDIEFSRPGWLAALVAVAARPEVGVAGARLLYPDGRVQHAGLVLAGEARVRHAERFLPGRCAGFGGRQRAETPVVGVTGALMAIRRSLFERLGGFDADRFGVLFNDVDLCLKAHAAGFTNLLVPAAEAVHHESATIGQRLTGGLFERGGEIWQYERAVEGHRFRQDWAGLLDGDPFYPAEFDPLDAGFRRRV